MTLPRPRPTVRTLAPVTHGSVRDAELASLGLRRADMLDFSASLNPLGPSPRALAALRGLDVSRYPEDGAPTLRQALADQAGVGVEQVLVGNGSSELLWLLALAYLTSGQRALVAAPTFGEYARAIRMAGADLAEWRASEDDGFTVDIDAVERLIRHCRPLLTVVGNPNNPTGHLLSAEALLRLAAAHDDGMLLVDEAYLPFVAEAPELAPQTARYPLVLLRSLTKIQSLAGLRLGYVVAPSSVVDALDRVRPPWNVNSAAQAAGLAALADVEHVRRSRQAAREARDILATGLAALGLPVVPSAANFLLVRVGNAATWRRELLRRGFCVRDCTSFGLPEYVRIGVRRTEDCARLLDGIGGLSR